MKYLILLSMFFVSLGCQPVVLLASPSTAKKKNRSVLSAEDQMRQNIIRRAKSQLSRRYPVVKGKAFRADCSGFIEAVSYGIGIDLYKDYPPDFKGSGVDLIRNYLATDGSLDLETPKLGDLIFFSDTYDKNRDGLRNDPLTHIGVIEKIDEDGTIHYIHHSNGRVRRGFANLFHPNTFKSDNNKILNSYLRRRRTKDVSSTLYMSGDLAVGFGSFLPPSMFNASSQSSAEYQGPPAPSSLPMQPSQN